MKVAKKQTARSEEQIKKTVVTSMDETFRRTTTTIIFKGILIKFITAERDDSGT